jgi:hypothetical protein
MFKDRRANEPIHDEDRSGRSATCSVQSVIKNM